MFINSCPSCGAQESLELVLLRSITDDEVQKLVTTIVQASLPLAATVLRYLRLYKTEKQQLRLGTVRKVLAELAPDLARNTITRDDRTWLVTHEQWQQAFQALFDAVKKGTVALPLQHNNYVYSVLCRLADQTAAKQEAQAEADRRAAPPAAPVTVRGQPKSIADALAGATPQAPIPPAPPPGPRTESPLVRRMKAELAAKNNPTGGQ